MAFVALEFNINDKRSQPNELSDSEKMLCQILKWVKDMSLAQAWERGRSNEINCKLDRLLRLHEGHVSQGVSEAIKESSEAADEVQAAIDAEQIKSSV